jgi:DNA-binding beta-propeller fold protein YncE
MTTPEPTPGSVEDPETPKNPEPPLSPDTENPPQAEGVPPLTETAEPGEAEGIPPADDEEDRRKRRLLLLLLLLLLLCLCCIGTLFARYLMNKQPVTDLVPTQLVGCYEPAYKFSFGNVDGPVSVAVSPDNQRVYVAESGGKRLVKMFDRDGNLILSFAPPGTDPANREPKYMAVGSNGRVYLVDRTSSAIDIYDADGNFIDAIISQHLTLTKYLVQELGSLPAGLEIQHYEGINKLLTYKVPDQKDPQVIKITFPANEPQWSPLGLRFDSDGNLIYTDTTEELHSVHIIPADALNGDLSKFNPNIEAFGSQGNAKDQFDFPQTVVKDGKGNFYVSDGNNARVDVWASDMKYESFFGFGSSVNGALNLPRGTWMGRGGCLLVADAVGSLIRVYNVSGAEPALAFELGEYGFDSGQFNYPVDVIIDGTGRLYIADSANNRIQVWSY